MYDDERYADRTQQTEEFFDPEPDAEDVHDDVDFVNDAVDADQPPAEYAAESLELIGQLHTGANWFYWIAALSVVNSVVVALGSEWNFVVGLGITLIIDVVAAAAAQGADGTAALIIRGIALTLSVVIAGMFAALGYFANRAHRWAFLVGMLFYTFDGLIFLFVKDWFGLGFHAFALFGLFAGLRAAQQLKRQAVEQQFQLAPEAA